MKKSVTMAVLVFLSVCIPGSIAATPFIAAESGIGAAAIPVVTFADEAVTIPRSAGGGHGGTSTMTLAGAQLFGIDAAERGSQGGSYHLLEVTGDYDVRDATTIYGSSLDNGKHRRSPVQGPPEPVPEPGALLLIGTGVLCATIYCKRQKYALKAGA